MRERERERERERAGNLLSLIFSVCLLLNIYFLIKTIKINEN